MKKQYASPVLLEYGRLDALTLGTAGTLPDFVGNVVVNNNCPTQTSTVGTVTVSRTSCDNVLAPTGS
jgi:hypothetical protein